ncbi:DUF222 domain-containing protein [Dermacoccaceae bacterium W4C1]
MFEVAESPNRPPLAPAAVAPGRRAAVAVAAAGFGALPAELATESITRAVQAVGTRLAAADAATDPVEAIDRITALQNLIHQCEGALVEQQVVFAEQQREAQREAGVPARRVGGGIAEQVGFARRISPAAAARKVNGAVRLRGSFPRTLNALRTGEVSQRQCDALLRGTSHLDEDGCAVVDAALAPRMHGWNTRQTEQAVTHVTYRLDPAAFVARRGHAESERAVWLRPAPDCMALISAFVPVAEGVATLAALRQAATAAQAAGDPRTLGQLMADTLTARATHPACDSPSAAEDRAQGGCSHCGTDGSCSRGSAAPNVEIALVMDASTLLGLSDHPGHLNGYGPIPADLAREIAYGAIPDSSPTTGASVTDAKAAPTTHVPTGGADGLVRTAGRRWIRRLLTDPVTGVLTAQDSRRRTFDDTARRFLATRDRHCRQPYCDAPIRHIDHIHPHSRGGPTSIDNGQGLCERGNYIKDLPGWRTRPGPEPGTIIVTTPTGHDYETSTPAHVGLPATNRSLGRSAPAPKADARAPERDPWQQRRYEAPRRFSGE